MFKSPPDTKIYRLDRIRMCLFLLEIYSKSEISLIRLALNEPYIYYTFFIIQLHFKSDSIQFLRTRCSISRLAMYIQSKPAIDLKSRTKQYYFMYIIYDEIPLHIIQILLLISRSSFSA